MSKNDERGMFLGLSTMTKKILESLTPREIEVLETRFGINGKTKPPGVVEIERKFARKLEKIAEKHHSEARKKKGEEEEEGGGSRRTFVEDRKITIVFQQRGDQDVVETWLSHPLDSLQIVDGFMWSLVSLLRTNGYQNEEIPDVVRESLREAMLGDSIKLNKPVAEEEE